VRIWIAIFCSALLVSGCATIQTKPASTPGVSITPDFRPVGKVVSFNPEKHYVVLTFPIGSMPRVGQRLNLYHNNVKIGDLEITGPTRDFYTIATVLAGQPRTDDEARED
jgi:hypothetical protein